MNLHEVTPESISMLWVKRLFGQDEQGLFQVLYFVEDYLFVPFSVETLGPWSESTKKFTKDIGRRLIERSGDRRAAEFLTQRISLAIQRGNSAAAMGTLPMGWARR
ncbi:uncharacterized protein LOC103516087 isoform X1 [Diaphorina citri]|uniref:Uncharacterized protein LOC103516087 isoform X1 n=1 Tax=Diaphorina citri TaxID=121845 RepID=A0A1S3DD51_DIACI|nr:uncharacterized protein LOC103516087 isoform X1 [Diaphorina citri]